MFILEFKQIVRRITLARKFKNHVILEFSCVVIRHEKIEIKVQADDKYHPDYQIMNSETSKSFTLGYIQAISQGIKMFPCEKDKILKENKNPKELFSDITKRFIWKEAKKDTRFNPDFFRIDILGCLVINRSNCHGMRAEKLAVEYEHVHSHSYGGKGTLENGVLLNALINNKKKQKMIIEHSPTELQDLKKECGIDAHDFYNDIEKNIHNVCEKYDLIFIKENGIVSIVVNINEKNRGFYPLYDRRYESHQFAGVQKPSVICDIVNALPIPLALNAVLHGAQICVEKEKNNLNHQVDMKKLENEKEHNNNCAENDAKRIENGKILHDKDDNLERTKFLMTYLMDLNEKIKVETDENMKNMFIIEIKQSETHLKEINRQQYEMYEIRKKQDMELHALKIQQIINDEAYKIKMREREEFEYESRRMKGRAFLKGIIIFFTLGICRLKN